MNISINSKFKNSGNNFGSISLTNFNTAGFELYHLIQQYENQQQCHQEVEEKKKNDADFEINNISEVCLQAYVKTNTKPVRMFKDRMEVEKENIEKKAIVKELENVNKKLKLEYDSSLNNNKKMEMFLKEIEFIFKNDRSNQKANETLLKATKTLHREKQESKNYIEKLVKKAKTNEMRELKTYLKVLENQKNRISELLTQEIAQNEKLRKQQDFNHEELQNFQLYQNLTTEILSTGLKDALRIRQNYKKEKSIIKTALNSKEVQYIKREISKIDRCIAEQLLRKEGLDYEIEILKNKAKQKNKRNMKQQGSLLKTQIKKTQKKLSLLQQQLKQKTKTHEYIIRWTKQLKSQLQQLKQNHITVKEQYEEEINKLSRQIQEWNRKYKAELIEEQNGGKKGAVRESQGLRESMGVQRRIRVVKVEEVQRLRRILGFYFLGNGVDVQGFIREKILGYGKTITLKELHKRLCDLEMFQDEDQAQIFKLARYIVQDNNQTYTKINPEQQIQSSLANLILKNLLSSHLTSQNLPQTTLELKSFLDKNYDELRHSLWVDCGKSVTFTLTNLRNAFGKFGGLQGEAMVGRFVEFFQYAMWRKEKGSGDGLRIGCFQRVCQDVLGRKLVKDAQGRMSKTTIRSVFDKLYLNQDQIHVE